MIKKSKPQMKKGGSLGMKSVKSGFDKNPNVTRADIIVAAKKKAQAGGVVSKKPGEVVPKKPGGVVPKNPPTPKKAQAGGVASKKIMAPMVDPKGAFTKVQERTIAGKKIAKKGASVKKSVAKCKYGCN
jgi:hypothetical protein